MKRENTRIKGFVQPNRRLIAVFLVLILAVSLIVTSACGSQALPPKLYVGDQWIYKQIQGNTTYTRTERIVGEETIEGKACYVVNVVFSPPLQGWVGGYTEWRDKATYSPVRQRFCASVPSAGNNTVNRLIEYSDQVTGSEWPYKVGNTFTVKESWTISDVFADQYPTPMTGEEVTTFKVTNIEEREFEFGNLTCFKTVGYQGGNATSEYWYSDKAKAYVKHFSPLANGTIDELVSYSVRYKE
jgi:hypothetical protein